MSAVFLLPGLYNPRREEGDLVRPRALRGGIASAYNTSIGIGDPAKLVAAGSYQLAAAGDTNISAVFAGWSPEDLSVYEKLYWITNADPPADAVGVALLAMARLLGRLAARELARPPAPAPDPRSER